MKPGQVDKWVRRLEAQPSAGLDSRIDDLLTSQPARGSGPTWTIGLRARAIPVAFVAIALLLAVAVVPWFNGDKSNVWAQALENARNIGDYAFTETMTKKSLGPSQTETVFEETKRCHASEKYGSYTETYVDGELAQKTYTIRESNEIVQVFPRIRAYLRRPFNSSGAGYTPKDIVLGGLASDYEELGEETLDGRTLVGIRGRRVFGGRTDAGERQWEVWFDRETLLPARTGYESSSTSEDVFFKRQSQYSYNQNFSKDLFERNIPDDYVPTVVSGLRLYAELTGGTYPWSLHPGVLQGAGSPPEAEAYVDHLGTRGYEEFVRADDFLRSIVTEGGDCVYLGNDMTAGDFDRVLLYWRWKGPNQDYQVVWGDLRVETLSRDQLIETSSAVGDAKCLLSFYENGSDVKSLVLANRLGEIGDASIIPALLRHADLWPGEPADNPFPAAVEAIRRREERQNPSESLVMGRLLYANGRSVTHGWIAMGSTAGSADRHGYFVRRVPRAKRGTGHLVYACKQVGNIARLFFLTEEDQRGTLTVILECASTVRGRIVDPDGNPVPDVRVGLTAHLGENGGEVWPQGDRTTTDADGRFAFEKVPVGAPLELVVDAPVQPGGSVRVPIDDIVPDEKRDLGEIVVPPAEG